jgi:hypothetical protein
MSDEKGEKREGRCGYAGGGKEQNGIGKNQIEKSNRRQVKFEED